MDTDKDSNLLRDAINAISAINVENMIKLSNF